MPFGGSFPPSRTFVLLGWLGWLLLNHVLPAASIDCARDSVNVENRLKKSLFCNGYRADARPRKDHTQTVNLTLSYFVLGYEFNEAGDLLELNVMLNLQWHDDFIRWNRTEWSQLERITVNSEELWLPDFRHFSSYYNPEALPDCTNPECFVRSDGLVTCIPVCSLNAKCDADYSRWPYDTHRCTMWYGTWANSMDEVDMHVQDVCLPDRSAFESPKWDMVSLAKKRSTIRSGDNYMYPIVNINVTLRRRASFENVAILWPILLLGLLNLYIVWLRSNSLERKVLLVVSLYVHASYMNLLDWTLPINGETAPGCLSFLFGSLIMTTVIVVLTLLNCWIRSGLNRDSPTGSFLNRWTGSFSDSRVAELILAADYLELNYVVTKDTDGNCWEKRGKLFDRVLAIVCVVFYIVIVCVFISFGHQASSNEEVNCVLAFKE